MAHPQVTIEQSAHGPAVLVPAGYDSPACIEMPAADPDQRWNAVIQAGARAVLYERDLRQSEIIVEAGAQLDLVALQADEHPTKHEVVKTIILHDHAVVRLFTGLFGSATVKIVGDLSGNQSVFENHVIYFGSGSQAMRMELNAIHRGRQTMSRTLVRGVALDRAHADFSGTIVIEQTGAGTDGHLEHEGLLLSRRARIDSLPGLEIGTNDVRATHASAVHYIRPEQLFYLQSRGIEPVSAKRMIVTGFLDEMLATVHEPGLLAEVRGLVNARQDFITE